MRSVSHEIGRECMVKVESIRKNYGKRRILSDVSFQLNRGESIVILGRNGCGKTTLMQLLSGITKSDGGNITYFGNEMKYGSRQFRKLCGYVPQENPLVEDLSVLDNLKLWGYKKDKDPSLLVEFDLQDIVFQKVRNLSGGMKRRLSIACAFVTYPPIMILDEPTAALDLYYRSEIMNWLLKYKKSGGIVIMTSHEEAEIKEADQCMLLQDGVGDLYKGNDRSMRRILSLTREELENGTKI